MTDNTHKALAAKMCRDESHAYAQLVAEEKAHASQPINQPTEGLEDRARTQGWNAACDALCNWLNSLDTEDMGINDLRSAVYGWCQENVGQVAAAPIDGLAGQLEKALNQADKRLVAGENTTLIAGWIADFCRNHREVILARLSQPSPGADVQTKSIKATELLREARECVDIAWILAGGAKRARIAKTLERIDQHLQESKR